MDSQIIAVGALGMGAVAMFFALRRQGGHPANSRMAELEEEVQRLTVRVTSLQQLTDVLIERNGELSRRLDRAIQDYQMIDNENRSLRRRLSEMGLKE